MNRVKEKIIEVSTSLFMNYGIRSITMDDISKELSISKKTIYQYFKDKNEIVHQVALQQVKKQKEALINITSEESNAIEKLHMISHCMRENHKKVNPSLPLDIRRYYPETWDLFMDFKDQFTHGILIGILKNGIDEGYFRSDINPVILATLRLTELEMAFDKKLFPDNTYNTVKVHFQLFEHFVHGIMTEKGIEEFNTYINNKVIQ